MEVSNILDYAKILIHNEDHDGVGVNCHSFVHSILSKYLGLGDVPKEQGFRSIRYELYRLMIGEYSYEYGKRFDASKIEPNPEFVEFLTGNPIDIMPYLVDNLVTYHVVSPKSIPDENGNYLGISHSGIILPSMYQNDMDDPGKLLCIERKSSSFVAKKALKSSSGVAVRTLASALENFEEVEMDIIYVVWKRNT